AHSSFPLSFISTSPSYTYPLSLHDTLPIFTGGHERPAAHRRDQVGELYRPSNDAVVVGGKAVGVVGAPVDAVHPGVAADDEVVRSEEHTSELQSRENLVFRLLLEKKKTEIK